MSKSYPFPKKGWSGTCITTSAQIRTGEGTIGKVIVNSNTSGSFKLFDGTLTAMTAIGGTYTPTTATSSINLIEIDFTTGLYVGIGGTANLTVLYDDK